VTPALPVEALDLALAAIAPYDRPDLDARLQQAKARLTDGRVRVLVVGEFKQGKSFLVDCLVGALVCPVHDDIATSVPTLVRNAEVPSVALVRSTDPAVDPRRRRDEYRDIPIEHLASYVARAATPGEQFSHVEVGIPRAILADGLEIVDTPGVGGFNSVHGAATMAALPSADAVLLVSDASQEYTAPELEFVRQAIRVCPNVACVLTKIDLYPEWRRIAELDQAHLKQAGIETEMFAVSSAVRWHSLVNDHPEFDSESGFPSLVRYLRERVVGQADKLARRSTIHDVLAVTDQLIGALRSEKSAQESPETIQELISELSESQSRSAALKERSARWQQTLKDGVADLNADIDYDLRERMRDILRLAEEEIDGSGDPTKIWDQLTGWVQEQAAAAVSANFLWAMQRADWLATQVAEHFSEDREEALPALRTGASNALQTVRAMNIRENERWHLGQKALTGLRGGYIGVLMFGLMGTFIGLSVINPFSVGAGLLLGGKAISDERRRVIAKRQNAARQAVRRYIDDATFAVGKDSKDMLRLVQRDLRDHFMAYADQMNLSLKESLRAAERSVESTTADRKRRLAEIATELGRLEELQKEVRTLLQPQRSSGTRKTTGTGRRKASPRLVPSDQ
jgi:predicted GTPase